ncbi:MAG: isoprenyl transferase [Clostridiales bacterium]|nr:isoprenyl transferase [Clostridiales bacterium]
MKKKNEIDLNRLPEHIAIIMDGNGRWAKKRLLSRKAGHKAGAQALRVLSEEMNAMGFHYLTVYAFSTENWNRSEEEVYDLMNLLRDYIQQYIEDTKKNNMRVNVIGDRSRLDRDLQDSIAYLEQLTLENDGLCVNIAVNYGGRDEITRAAKKLAADCMDRKINLDEINPDRFAAYLDTTDIPDPELLIRTSGEMRLSNFILWQCAYSEFYFSDKLWPDYKIADLLEAIWHFQNRDRRFGGR